MTGWLIYRLVDVERNKAYIEFYIEEGKALGIDIKLILVDKIQFGVNNKKLFLEYDGLKIDKPDFAINRSIYPILTSQLEDMDIRVFNNSKISEICNDKAKTYQYLSRLNIPIVDTKFVKGEYLAKTLDKTKDKVIVKGVSGHGGNEVFLYNPQGPSIDKEKILSSLKHTDIVIQPLVGNKNQDLRVYIIGKKIIAAILRTAKSGFKSNFSLGGEVRRYKLSDEETQLVTSIIDYFDFGLVGIDFLIDEDGGLVFNEIEDVVGARMLYQCTDINIVRLYLEYIIKEIEK